jgi:putative ABC transport system ATP-binding protein
MTDAMVDLRDVHLTLGSVAGPVNILRGLSFRVERGEAVGVVGPSGSGKSTMLAIMGGLERASTGVVRVADTDLTKLDEDGLARFRRARIGIVFQSFHLIPTMTALENVAVPLELAGRRDAFAVAKAELQAVGLGHRIDHYPAQLSGGEQQRVALARAMAPQPALILADEPTGNLDGANGRAVLDLLLTQTKTRGGTLVLITHDMAVARACDRVARIEDGRVVDDGRAGSEVVAAVAE